MAGIVHYHYIVQCTMEVVMLCLRLLPAWSPALYSCLLHQLHSQQVFWRSQCFYAGRVINSPAPLQDKARRLSRRGCADILALLHDCSEAQFALGEEWVHVLRQDKRCRPWARILDGFQQRVRTVCLRAFVETGRATLVAPGHRP